MPRLVVTNSTKKTLLFVWLLILAAAAVKTGWEMARMLHFEAGYSLNSDVLIYLTMGRGILNGLVPYRDLFESKPIGIFYLAATSLFLTRGLLFLRAIEIANLLFLPVSCGLVAWNFRRQDRLWNAVSMVTALVFGSILAIWAEEHAGGMQTEIFVMLPAGLYALSITAFADRRGVPWMVARTVCVLVTILMREPFAIGICCAAMIACKTWKDAWEMFILPSLLAGVAAGVLLFSLGVFGAYLRVYLPDMIFHRSNGGGFDPLSWRLLWIQRFLESYSTFSSMYFLGYALAFLWGFAILSKTTRPILSGIALVLGIAWIHEAFVLAAVFTKAAKFGFTPWMVLSDPSFRLISFLYFIGTTGLLGLFGFLAWKSPRDAIFVLLGLLTLPLMTFSTSLGGYLKDYLLYPLPAFLACLFLLFGSRWKWPLFVLSLFACVIIFSYIQTEKNKDNQYPQMIGQAEEFSAQLDAIMTACHFQRFYSMETNLYAFSHFSPVGPIFIPYVHTYLGPNDAMYQETEKEVQQKAQLFIKPIVGTHQPYPFSANLDQFFTSPIPACAKGLPVPAGFQILYRT